MEVQELEAEVMVVGEQGAATAAVALVKEESAAAV